MPNWCDNTLTITHTDKSKLDAIDVVLSNKDSKDGLFNIIRPNPTGEWDYAWSVDNWGSKWDASIHDWERQDDNTIWVSFDSAWSPPIALYEFMEEEGYTVEAMYWESGMAYCGAWRDGYDDYYNYDITDRDSLDKLPEDILDFTGLIDRHEDWIAEEQAEEYQEYLMTVTDWYPVDVNPAHVGEYEVTEEGSPNWPFYKKVLWDGKKWTLNGKKYKVGTWRGLRADPNETKMD